MSEEIGYMLGIVAVGFAINFGLRALPFILFAGKNRELPRGVERFGAIVSPVIIVALIFYSYSGLEWKSAYPYIAGLLVVGLQIWKRNPLVSILAGTILYMVLLSCCGCASPSHSIRYDGAHPCVSVSHSGVKFDNHRVLPQEVPHYLEKYRVPKSATIHILLEDGYDNERALWVFQHNILGKAGYHRSILVSKRKAKSHKKGSPESQKGMPLKGNPPPQQIKYKKAK